MMYRPLATLTDLSERMDFFGKRGIPFFFLIDFEHKRPQLFRLDALPEDIDIDFPGFHSSDRSIFQDGHFIFEKYPISMKEYQQGFSIVMDGLMRGDSFLLNLSFPTRIITDLSFSEIFEFSQAKYKIRYKSDWVCFSPESFVRIQDGFISSYPMKGTIDAAVDKAAETLLNDQKEKAEHNTIVDLIRNDLSRVAKDVEVSRFRYIDRIKTHDKEILQASSEIKGKLPDNYQDQLGKIITSLLPAGSISGAPKKKTMEIIRKAEGIDRGYYTGIAGIYDGKNLDTCVMIRFIERRGNELYFRSGGGITHQSDMSSEYQEMIDKVYVPIYRNDTDRQWQSNEHALSQPEM